MRFLVCRSSLLNQRFSHRVVLHMGSNLQQAGLKTLAQCKGLAISEAEDDPAIRAKYRPFLLPEQLEANDWISQLELDTAVRIAEADLTKTESRLKVLVLYGSLRTRSAPPPIHNISILIS
jgi:arsenic resistance protein ArsH